MEPIDRPNHEMEALVNEGIVLASKRSRPAAAEFLYKRGCSIDVIARVLAKHPEPERIRALGPPRPSPQDGPFP